MTEEEKQELAALRAEKVQRQQTERAKAALEQSGVPVAFAALLVGADDGATDEKVAAFCTAYQTSLAEDVKSRLPQQAPVVTAPLPQRPRRGVQRLR